MDLNAVGCFAPIVFFFILLGVCYAHHREVQAALKAIQRGQPHRLRNRREAVREGEAMPHDMNALMWYDL